MSTSSGVVSSGGAGGLQNLIRAYQAGGASLRGVCSVFVWLFVLVVVVVLVVVFFSLFGGSPAMCVLVLVCPAVCVFVFAFLLLFSFFVCQLVSWLPILLCFVRLILFGLVLCWLFVCSILSTFVVANGLCLVLKYDID